MPAVKPNIVLIVADQIRADSLHCSGNSQIRTPHLDALAAAGTMFNKAYTPCPICVPARATMITGNYPHKCTGRKANTGTVRDGQIKLPQLLADNGYRTYASGKLHYCPYSPPGKPRLLHGFEHAKLSESGRILAQFDPEGKQEGLEDYFDYLNEVGWGGYARAHAIGNNDIHPAPSPLPQEHNVDAWVATESIKFIEGHVKNHSGEPFFLNVGFPKPHAPFDPPRPFDSMYGPRELTSPAEKRDCEKRAPGKDIESINHGWKYVSPEARQVIKSHYYGLISFEDEQVGRIIDTLKENNLHENTIVMFVGDHGEMLGDFGYYFKSCMYEGSVRVPFIISWPQELPTGQVSDTLVGLQDITPTILSFAGVALPQAVDGKNLKPLLEQDAFLERDCIISYCLESPQQTYMITDGRYKYVYNEIGAIEEFYDLQCDPKEEWNLSCEAAHSAMMDQLKNRLKEWITENKDEAIMQDNQFVQSSVDIESSKFDVSALGWRWY